MKMSLIVRLFALALLAMSARGQGTFQNLDFESARVPGGGGGVDVTNALPGWAAFSGTTQLFTVAYSTYGGPFQNVGLVGFNHSVIAGNFSAVLGVIGGQAGSVTQTGLVPSDARSLLFTASPSVKTPSLAVSLGGANLPFLLLSTSLAYNVYGADVSAFAGQTTALSFMGTAAGFTVLDEIRFSPEAIPEPSAASLMLVGSGVLLYVRGKLSPRQSSARTGM